MTTTVNGVTAYTTSTSGTITSYIPQSGLTEDEIAHLDAREAEVPGTYTDVKTALQNSTWTPTGRTGWQHFGGYVLAYDSAADAAVISADFTVADTSTGMTQGELDDLILRVNALQNLTR